MRIESRTATLLHGSRRRGNSVNMTQFSVKQVGRGQVDRNPQRNMYGREHHLQALGEECHGDLGSPGYVSEKLRVAGNS